MSPEEELLAAIRSLLPRTANSRGEAEIAEALDVPKVQAHAWLRPLVDEGILEKPRGPGALREACVRGPAAFALCWSDENVGQARSLVALAWDADPPLLSGDC